MPSMTEPSHDSAVDRTLMAEERTYSAWVRTGLTSIASGLGIVKLTPGPLDVSVRILGVLLVVAGGLAFAFGFWGYRQGTRNWTAAHTRAVPHQWIAILSTLFLAATALTLYLIFQP